MNRIRIVFIGMPRMLREIVEEIVVHENGIEIGASYPDSVTVGTVLREADAFAPVREGSTVALLNVDGSSLLVQQLAPERVELEDYSPARLRAEIRAAARIAPLTPDPPSQPA